MASKKMSGTDIVKSKKKTSYLSKLAKKKTSENCIEEEQDKCSRENDGSQSKVCTETKGNEQNMSRTVGSVPSHQTKGSSETEVGGKSSDSEQNQNRDGRSIDPVRHETNGFTENGYGEKYNDSEQSSGIANERQTNEIKESDTRDRSKDNGHTLVGYEGKVALGHETEKSKNTTKNLMRKNRTISLERETNGSTESSVVARFNETEKSLTGETAPGHETKGSKDRSVEEQSKDTGQNLTTNSEKNCLEHQTERPKDTEENLKENIGNIAFDRETKGSKDRNVEEQSKDTWQNLAGKSEKISFYHKTEGAKDTEENRKGNNLGVAHSSETNGPKEYNYKEKSSNTKQKLAGISGLVVPEYGLKGSKETGGHDYIKTKHLTWDLLVNATESEISELDVDVIVSSEDAGLQGFGMVAKQLGQKGGEQYELEKMMASSMVGDLKSWHFIFTPGAGRLNCKIVAHVNIPKLEATDQEKWCHHFRNLVCRLVKRTNCMGFTSMAIPLLGTGRKGAPTDFVIELLCNQIRKCAKKPAEKVWLHTIYIVHPNRSIVRSIETVAKRLHLYRTPEVTQKPDVTISENKTRDDDKSFIEKYSVKLLKSNSDLAEEDCPICMEKIDSKERVELEKCHHVFCLLCVKQSFNVKPACPLCNVVYGIVRGNQPKGYMMEVFEKEPLPGFDGCGIIHIYYLFLDGIQDAEHPNPGKPYRGTRREAFLPDNKEGQRVHRLLRRSFQQQATFTIGSSRTTGREDVVTWNDIHHKTKIHGGPERYGYPDPLYLKRVQEELASKGISEATDS